MAYASFKDQLIARSLLQHILDSVATIRQRTACISCPNDFLTTPGNMEKLDAACMQLMAIGECVVKLDKMTEGELHSLEPDIPWGAIKGVRNFIAHGYFDIDEDEIYKIINSDLVPLSEAVLRILNGINGTNPC